MALVHLFYVVNVIQALITCYSNRCFDRSFFDDWVSDNICKIIGESELAQKQFFLAKFIDSSCHPKDMIRRYVKQQCSHCKSVPDEPALCLICGLIMFTKLEELLQRTTILLQRSTRQAFWPSLYLDAYGEEDLDMSRGRPLYLNEERYKALTYLVASHSLDHTSEELKYLVKCCRVVFHSVVQTIYTVENNTFGSTQTTSPIFWIKIYMNNLVLLIYKLVREQQRKLQLGRMKIFLGGYFGKENNLQCIGGIAHILEVDPKDFSFDELIEFIQELGAREATKIHYRVSTSAKSLQNSLILVYDKDSCSRILEVMQQFGPIESDVEHSVPQEDAAGIASVGEEEIAGLASVEDAVELVAGGEENASMGKENERVVKMFRWRLDR
ncbi:hypothetical protein J5N97_030231 [Dioscorea zingiberensis]|uniref:E3 ubiquitin-protein ligase n=1 Tax=Dioscorea zingiberensis TaxID=325984 RepID=A0A9D5H3X9_9LILI|nr:hypothetical protein J5N97_030231 [Dioscorea zingiberensis]